MVEPGGKTSVRVPGQLAREETLHLSAHYYNFYYYLPLFLFYWRSLWFLLLVLLLLLLEPLLLQGKGPSHRSKRS